jgi:hypothetical protein
MTPFIVLATYKPEIWSPRRVGLELCAITKKAGLKPHYDPKHGPNHMTKTWWSEALHAEIHRRTADVKAAEGFHYDGDTTPGSNPECCLVLWSTNNPTEIMYQGKIYRPKPYDLVIFKNRSVTHRRPENCPKVRWLFRQRVALPTHMKLP